MSEHVQDEESSVAEEDDHSSYEEEDKSKIPVPFLFRCYASSFSDGAFTKWKSSPGFDSSTFSGGVIKSWSDAPSTMIPIIHKLMTGGLRIWIYSGDTDGRVPVTSTRYSIKKMGLKVELPWRSWFHKSQVAGWVDTYAGGLTFATVRGAGHQVLVFAAPQSPSLFSHFLSSLPLPPKRL